MFQDYRKVSRTPVRAVRWSGKYEDYQNIANEFDVDGLLLDLRPNGDLIFQVAYPLSFTAKVGDWIVKDGETLFKIPNAKFNWNYELYTEDQKLNDVIARETLKKGGGV